MLPGLYKLSRSLVRPVLAARLIRVTTMGTKSSKEGDMDTMFRAGEEPKPELNFTEQELRTKLTEEEFNVTQNKGTDRAFTGRYVDLKEDGKFHCVVCDTVLFGSDKKFESGSGWPSFTDVVEKGNVHRIVDTSLGMARTEVVCAKCGAHLGHVFDDGPSDDTGLRYCVNSCSLKFNKKS